MAKLFANSGDPDQKPHSAASDLGLHCLPITLLLVSRLHGPVTSISEQGCYIKKGGYTCKENNSGMKTFASFSLGGGGRGGGGWERDFS